MYFICHYFRLTLAIPKSGDGSQDAFDKCRMYAVNYTQLLADGVRVADPTWPTKPCDNGWEFSFTDVPYSTIATDVSVHTDRLSYARTVHGAHDNDRDVFLVYSLQLGWVCENATKPAIAQAIFFVGAIVGGLLFGWMADRFGRIPALVGCNLVGFVAGVSTAFSYSFWTFTICRFFLGFAFDNCFTMMYILGMY